ncbi:MAG: hypothetical protein NZO16_05270 [Deltaproteobacteria bacterium]|nr:hypothetical protein [Deltaproteobacteria bacterium]
MESAKETIVKIDGQEYVMDVSGINKVPDFLQAIQAYIDPNNMVVEILFNGCQLSDSDWTVPFTRFNGGSFEIKTDTPTNFALSRLREAPMIVNAILKIIRDARLFFAEGNVNEANQLMLEGVRALREFFNWFNSVFRFLPEEFVDKLDISKIVEKLTKECEKVASAQLYQSWWGISETLKNNVEPLLDELETHIRLALRGM